MGAAENPQNRAHKEAMADSNCGELRRTRNAPAAVCESQGDLIVLRDARRRITFVNDAYANCARSSRGEMSAESSPSMLSKQGESYRREANGEITDQRIATALGPPMDRMAEGLVDRMPDSRPRCNPAAATSTNAPRRERDHEGRDQADAANRAK